jgi:hypothetical protein
MTLLSDGSKSTSRTKISIEKRNSFFHGSRYYMPGFYVEHRQIEDQDVEKEDRDIHDDKKQQDEVEEQLQQQIKYFESYRTS